MALGALTRNGGVSERMDGAPSVTALAKADGTVTVLYAAGRIPAGKAMRLRPAPDWRGPPPADLLAGIAKDKGGKPLPRTAPGEPIVFTAGYADGDDLVVQGLAGRVHDAVVGKAQVAYALASPSRTSSSDRGLTQFVTVADPSASRRVSTAEQLADLARAMAARAWPGGMPGFLFRDGSSTTLEEYPDRLARGHERPEAFVARLDRSGLFRDGTVEALPIWSIPMGRDQVMRERLSPTERTAGPRAGAFTSLYKLDASNRRSFAPTVLLLGDEEEWAFGGKTGANRRVVLAAQPLGLGDGHGRASMPSAVRAPKGVTPWGFKVAEPDESRLEAAASARAARAPGPATPTATASAPRMGIFGRPVPRAAAPATPAPAAAPRPMGRLGMATPAACAPAGAAPSRQPAAPARGLGRLRPAPAFEDDEPSHAPGPR